MRAPHDWNAIAAHALDLLPSPTAVVDFDGVVRGWNAALENLAGRMRNDVIGRTWSDVRGDVDDVREPLEQSIVKGRREATSLLRTADDRRLALRLSIARLGEGKGQLAIVTIVAHQAADAAATEAGGDLAYEVSAAFADRWTLRGVRGRAAESRPREGVCYEALQRRSSPCPGCPALAITAGESRTAVIPSGHGHEPVR
ncbi:MAG: PAS domain-containing protein, partial [Polyangiales bacterium]